MLFNQLLIIPERRRNFKTCLDFFGLTSFSFLFKSEEGEFPLLCKYATKFTSS